MNKKYRLSNSKLILNITLLTFIVLSICVLSVGYAAITSLELNIELNISANQYQEIFISEVKYLNDIDADLENSKIVDYTDTLLHSDIYLSKTNASSSITYEITIFNNSDALKQFAGVEYSNEFYSNNDIEFNIDGFSQGDLIEKGESKTFNITFYYKNLNISNNELDSYLNFKFDYYFDIQNDVDMLIKEDGSFEFAGISPSNPINITNISNIHFNIINGSEKPISAIRLDIKYTTATGSTQSCKIDLVDENDRIIQTQTVSFRGKQNNTTATVTFNNLNIESGHLIEALFDQATINNGRVDISGLTITPIF